MSSKHEKQSQTTGKPVRVAHRSPGRIRLVLTERLSEQDLHTLVEDLRLSPEVKGVRTNGKSLVIEHSSDSDGWSFLERHFPQAQLVNDRIDATISRATQTPELNKVLPMGLLAFAFYKASVDGAVLAGESAFALAYIAFDLYWKFQQENVTRKIHEGLTRQEQQRLDQTAA